MPAPPCRRPTTQGPSTCGQEPPADGRGGSRLRAYPDGRHSPSRDQVLAVGGRRTTEPHTPGGTLGAALGVPGRALESGSSQAQGSIHTEPLGSSRHRTGRS